MAMVNIRNINARAHEGPWVKPYEKANIVIIGAGGIGSNCFLPIVKNNPKRLAIYDNDMIEPNNLGNQFYPMKDVGNNKSNSCHQTAVDYGNYPGVASYNHRINTPYDAREVIRDYDVVILAVDNMKTRQLFYEAYNRGLTDHEDWLLANPSAIETELRSFKKVSTLMIDGRMTAEDWHLFTYGTAAKRDVGRYGEYLFDDREVADLPCGFKSTMHTGQMLGGMISGLINNHLAGEMRSVPFKMTWNFPLMMMETED